MYSATVFNRLAARHASARGRSASLGAKHAFPRGSRTHRTTRPGVALRCNDADGVEGSRRDAMGGLLRRGAPLFLAPLWAHYVSG